MEGSTAQTELCQECKASSILLSACRDAAGEKAVCSLFAPGELSSTRNAGLPCIPEQEWVCGALVIQMSTINYMVRSCSTVSHSGGSRLLNSRSWKERPIHSRGVGGNAVHLGICMGFSEEPQRTLECEIKGPRPSWLLWQIQRLCLVPCSLCRRGCKGILLIPDSDGRVTCLFKLVSCPS